MSAHPKIAVLDRLLTGESANPAPGDILAGIPRARASNQYTEPSQQFFCGIWTSTAGKWRVRYTEHEFCVIIEGRVRIESVTGEKHEFRAGDALPGGIRAIQTPRAAEVIYWLPEQAALVVGAEAQRGVRRETRRAAQRRVRRIEIHEVAGLRELEHRLKRSPLEPPPRASAKMSCTS